MPLFPKRFLGWGKKWQWSDFDTFGKIISTKKGHIADFLQCPPFLWNWAHRERAMIDSMRMSTLRWSKPNNPIRRIVHQRLTARQKVHPSSRRQIMVPTRIWLTLLGRTVFHRLNIEIWTPPNSGHCPEIGRGVKNIEIAFDTNFFWTNIFGPNTRDLKSHRWEMLRSWNLTTNHMVKPPF